MQNDACALCAELQHNALSAIIRHFKLAGSLDNAQFRNDKGKMTELYPVIEQAHIERGRTTEAYKRHIRSHGEVASALRNTSQ